MSTVHASRADVRKAWFHEGDYPLAQLFKSDGPLPPVGSPDWIAKYPNPFAFPPKIIPYSWVDRLNDAVSRGLIPDIPLSELGSYGSAVYPSEVDPQHKAVCSAAHGYREERDIWEGAAGTTVLSFDDGPLPPSPKLYKFLKENSQKAAHFFIGSNILRYPEIFLQAFEDNQNDICVHTYTHPHMTTLSNINAVAELGYTIQIIYDSTGGRIPKYWRPPYGDVDNRIRAIARHVFGLTTVMWSHDSEDWRLITGDVPISHVTDALSSFYSGPKSNGLLVLEHEHSDAAVQAFVDSYHLIGQNGWMITRLPNIDVVKDASQLEGHN